MRSTGRILVLGHNENDGLMSKRLQIELFITVA